MTSPRASAARMDTIRQLARHLAPQGKASDTGFDWGVAALLDAACQPAPAKFDLYTNESLED